jgi:hypothetical protein
LRSIGAVAAGFFAVVVLSLGADELLHVAKVYPPWGQRMSDPLFVLATAYRFLFTVVGNYLTARLAPARPMLHSMALGAVGVVAATAGAVATWNLVPELGPHWYSLALIVMAPPCAWLGGKIREMQLKQA